MKKIEKKDIWLFMLINLGLILGLPDVPGAELAWLKRMGYHMTKM